MLIAVIAIGDLRAWYLSEMYPSTTVPRTAPTSYRVYMFAILEFVAPVTSLRYIGIHNIIA
jgi:hypothetical protein